MEQVSSYGAINYRLRDEAKRAEPVPAPEDPNERERIMRGRLTEEIQQEARNFLGREIDVTELRLYPYLDFQMKNEQLLDPRRINPVERNVLSRLKSEGHIEGGASGLSMTREFYDYINRVLWLAYVVAVFGPDPAQ